MAKTYQKPRPVEVGKYEGIIVACDTIPFHWRVSPDNPSGMTVRFVVDFIAPDGPATVTDAVDASNLQRLASVYRSAGEKMTNDILGTVHTLRDNECFF